MALVTPMLVLRAMPGPESGRSYDSSSKEASGAIFGSFRNRVNQFSLQAVSQPRSIFQCGAEALAVPGAGVLLADIERQKRARQRGIGSVSVTHIGGGHTAAVKSGGIACLGVPPTVAPEVHAVDA